MSPALRPIDVAERWQCSQAHVRALIKSGRLPAFKIGDKLLRIAPEALEEYEKCQITASSAIEASTPSNGAMIPDATDIRLGRIAARKPTGLSRNSSRTGNKRK